MATQKKRNGRKRSRVYWRDRGGEQRAYGDFRDLGGGREALVPKGEKRATTDTDIAAQLAADRVAELERRKRSKAILGLEGREPLAAFAEYHLTEKAKDPDLAHRTIVTAERHMRAAVEFFGADRLLDTIDVDDVEAWRDHLAATRTRTGKPMSPGTQRHYLNDLSNVYRRAQSRKAVTLGYNPVAMMMRKPSARTEEARWLEVHDAALLLESARTWPPPRPEITNPNIYAILATFILTGGRLSEVLGLAVTDIRFDRGTVTFRPHPWRRLKTKNAPRVVPLWPQLGQIVRDHLFGRDEASEGLLFPSPAGGGVVRDFRKSLNAIAKRAGWAEGEVTSKMFRHTYCAARLQTLDRGAPVSTYTVSREMGHGSLRLVERVYSHLGDVRHRSEVVEYRVDQHKDVLGDRLRALKRA